VASCLPLPLRYVVFFSSISDMCEQACLDRASHSHCISLVRQKFLEVGMIDFAGSGVVHLTGGLTALIAAIVLGPRKGRFYDEDKNPLENPQPFQPHSVALQVLGTFILWFGCEFACCLAR
jgi:hypothetical protein